MYAPHQKITDLTVVFLMKTSSKQVMSDSWFFKLKLMKHDTVSNMLSMVL